MDGALLAVSVVVNIVLLYALLLVWSGRQYFKGMYDDKEEKYFTDLARPGFKRYLVVRHDDVSGVSGTGPIAEVAEFSDGHAALHWLSKWPLTTPHPDGITSIEAIHGHEGKTKVVPLDHP